MRKVMVLFAATMILLLGVGDAMAGQVTHRKNTLKLLGIINIDKSLDSMVENMMAMQMKQSPQMSLYEEQLRTFYFKYIGWKALREDLAKMYMEEFNEKEIKELLAFYDSPLGRKAISSMGKLTQKTQVLQQRRVKDNTAELKASIDARTEELKKLQSK